MYRITTKGFQSTFEARFAFEPIRLQPHPLDLENRTCVAIARGPFIYCAETIDNSGYADLRSIRIPKEADFEEINGEGTLKSAIVLRTALPSQHLDQSGGLVGSKDAGDGTLTLIPYFMWANRGKSDLRVWLPSD